MKLVGRIPVEPLDDERLTNIERRIVAGAADAAARPVYAPRRYLGFAAATVAALAIGVLGFSLGSTTTPAPIVGEATPVRMDTAARGARLDIGDAQIHSDPSTVFVVTRPAGGVLVEMTRGKVELEVDKRGDRAPLVVRAGDTDVVVIGTRFSVDYGDGTGGVAVRVTEGAVKVVRHQQEIRVAAGEAWRTARGLVAIGTGPLAGDAATPSLEPDGAGNAGSADADTAALGPDGLTNTGDEPEVIAATGARPARGDFEIESGDAPDVLRDRVAQVPDPQMPGMQHPSGGSRATTTTSARGTIRPTIDPKDPKRDLKKLIASQRVEPALDVGEDAGSKAMAHYYKIIREQDGAAESQAFYSIAVTQHLKLARDADADKTLDDYFRRFSGKRYAEYPAALWLRVRIRCLKSIDSACRQAASAYARQAAEGPAANVAQRIKLDP